jgi:hypothetical protein
MTTCFSNIQNDVYSDLQWFEGRKNDNSFPYGYQGALPEQTSTDVIKNFIFILVTLQAIIF